MLCAWQLCHSVKCPVLEHTVCGIFPVPEQIPQSTFPALQAGQTLLTVSLVEPLHLLHFALASQLERYGK